MGIFFDSHVATVADPSPQAHHAQKLSDSSSTVVGIICRGLEASFDAAHPVLWFLALDPLQSFVFAILRAPGVRHRPNPFRFLGVLSVGPFMLDLFPGLPFDPPGYFGRANIIPAP